MTKRNLLRYIRIRELLVFSTIQPVMFVLLFAFVFGGAINTPGVSYIDYLIPGILIQAVVFGSNQTGVGLAEDLSKGMIDRFRSLPMARGAVLAGRTLSDTVRNVFVVLLMLGVGGLIGFRFQNGLPAAVGAIFIAVLFGMAFSWISAALGLFVKDVEAVQTAGFIWVFPIIFASSLYVPVETMPEPLRFFAQLNPITVAVDSVRGLALGAPFSPPIIPALIWGFGIIAIFMPLSIYRYLRISKEIA
ncbi:MAG: ABC transporter permease [Nitrososphaerales archaeon]